MARGSPSRRATARPSHLLALATALLATAACGPDLRLYGAGSSSGGSSGSASSSGGSSSGPSGSGSSSGGSSSSGSGSSGSTSGGSSSSGSSSSGSGSSGSGSSSGGQPPTSSTPTPVGGASRVSDSAAPGGYSVALASPGQGAEAKGLPAASTLAIQYASVSVGTLSVAVNDQVVRRVNVHSSGALTGSFLRAKVAVAIPAGATVTIRRAADDVSVNVAEIVVGSGDLGLPPDIWNLPALDPADGPYKADWRALGVTYSTPQWWRDAKFGGWAHWDPQSMPEHGDWYAYDMYIPGKDSYNFHLSHFGDPSVYGYKDVCRNWVVDRWDPASLMDVYVQMGVKFFMAMGAHHDNFDNWDSTYQPWNSVRIGVKKDIVGGWAQAARQKGLRFGIGFHNSPGRTWGQWMPVRYTSGSKGPYDALQTILDGKGKWWDGLDPVDLYGPVHDARDPLHSPFANQFMWRVDDAIAKYHPDVIYFDEHAGDSQVDLGVHMGLGFLAPPLAANYYNRSLGWNQGKMDVVINLKGVGGIYNSFQNSPDLLPFVERALVRSTEAQTEAQISAYPFQTEYNIQGPHWHYMAGASFTGAASLVTTLMQNVSRNGSLLLNLTQRGRGDLDDQLVQIARDIGAWLRVNGEAVYASRPFEVWGDDSVLYTRNNGNVYATLLNWNGGPVTLSALKSGGATLGTVSKVELLGSPVAMTFTQGGQGLAVTPGGSVPALPGLSDQHLASAIRVLRITHDKGWLNDDDPGTSAPGWLRRVGLGTGDYNDDLTTSDTPGAVWTATFTGAGVAIYAPKQQGAGKIEIQIDGQTRATADLATTGGRQPQQLVSEVTGLSPGAHAIAIINRGPGPVAVDAIVVR